MWFCRMRSLKQSTWSRIVPLSILLPWWWAFQHHRSSMKSLKELGLAGRKRTIQLWEGFSHPIKSQQVHLKRYLSIIKPGRHQRTLGSWTLQKHLHWRLKRTFSFAGFVKRKKRKKKLCSFTSISSLLLSTKTKGDFSRSLYQHYLTSSSGFDQITDQIPQDEYWNLLWFPPVTPSAVSQSMANCLFSQFLYFCPYGQNTAAIKIKTVKFQSWLNLGILTHMKKIFVSPWEIGKVKIDSLAFLTLALILTAGIRIFKWF